MGDELVIAWAQMNVTNWGLAKPEDVNPKGWNDGLVIVDRQRTMFRPATGHRVRSKFP